MNILCITHADFESPGIIETWARHKGHHFSIKRPYQGESLPDQESFDFLIVMGGPHSPLELEKAPYLHDEIQLIKKTLLQKKIILGFCLGAQLIGEALGAHTVRSPEKEVGVYPITLTDEGLADPLLEGLPSTFPVIHWHNDMPGLTQSAVLLGYSAGCPRQIIRFQPLVYGFQCHLEITLDGIKTMIAAVPEDLNPTKYTQNEQELLNQNYPAINHLMTQILDRLIIISS